VVVVGVVDAVGVVVVGDGVVVVEGLLAGAEGPDPAGADPDAVPDVVVGVVLVLDGAVDLPGAVDPPGAVVEGVAVVPVVVGFALAGAFWVLRAPFGLIPVRLRSSWRRVGAPSSWRWRCTVSDGRAVANAVSCWKSPATVPCSAGCTGRYWPLGHQLSAAITAADAPTVARAVWRTGCPADHVKARALTRRPMRAVV
jgi:hypothetical protein